ncbi:MAG: AraC family transcriptional regulator [Planctomycetota bacterium]
MPRSAQQPAKLRRAFFDRLGEEQVFVRLYDHLPAVYFFIKDAEGRFIYVNAALKKVLGKSDAQIIGRTDDDFFSPELADAYRAEDREVMAGGKTIADRVWLVPDARGTLNWFVSTKSPLKDRNGQAIGVAGAMQDVQQTGAVLGPYEQMSDVVRYVAEHYAEKITVDQLAELAHLSPSQFTRQFNRLFQTTPAKYLTRIRINGACSLLTRTDLGLATVAARCGFHDASHFVKQFKKQMGVTPGEYRAG